MGAALEHHNKECPGRANAILLNPVDHALMGWDELWGLPVLPDERVPIKRGQPTAPRGASRTRSPTRSASRSARSCRLSYRPDREDTRTKSG